MNTSIVAAPQRRRRRRHSPEFRARVIAACQQPGVSIASVALANGLNANMLRKWVIEAERDDEYQQLRSVGPESASEVPSARSNGGFVALTLPVTASGAVEVGGSLDTISIELRRADTSIKVQWPVAQATACASWLRDLLR